jgi:hypothetical protein
MLSKPNLPELSPDIRQLRYQADRLVAQLTYWQAFAPELHDRWRSICPLEDITRALRDCRRLLALAELMEQPARPGDRPPGDRLPGALQTIQTGATP